ncbi:MAG: UvrD-helicase domain-containing protein [Planctomycetes bacterium]|nr:UvrD-helicase domain-containing protein [Planctomycetota bacterium]
MPPTFDEIVASLTDAQREAVTQTDGPMLVLAGPGSGKTRVITCRIANLIHQGVRSHQILAITFTNKAAAEMKQRVAAMMPDQRIWISTFHSLGVRLLRQYADRLGLDRNFTIYDQSDRVGVVKAALKSAAIDVTRFTPETIQGAISKAKNKLLLPHQFEKQANDYFSQVVAQIYPVYEKKMRDANAVDFDDLLMWPALALTKDEEMRAELDARFRYVLVDEYQDTNKAQYEIARGLTIDHPNLCVVGDPDQSIYRWRGAELRNILDFERDYPNARVILLEENFRSTKAILRVADHLIAHNKKRKPKTLYTAKDEGSKVGALLFETGLEEADLVAQRIRQAVEAGKRHYRDFAILLRINALSRALESAFTRQRIPYQLVRGVAFFERKENRDVLAYLRLLLNPKDDLSFVRAVNEPARGIGKTSLEHLQKYAEPRELSLLAAAEHVDKIPAIRGKAVTGLKAFALMMAELRGVLEATPDEVMRQVIDRTGYRRMLKESDNPEDQERLANVEELITAAHQFHAEDESRTIADFLENITLASDVDGFDEKQDCVAVMTLHAAKGLEFPVVHMMALEQGILPHERSLMRDEELEEERRLAFVGITRAQEELYLSYARMREFRGQTLYAVPSMFLEELPQDGIETSDLSSSGGRTSPAVNTWRGSTAGASKGWYDTGFSDPKASREHERPEDDAPTGYEVGVMVHHDVYGVGCITEVSGQAALRKIKIRFSSGERSFLAAKAKLAIVQPT